MPRQRLRGSPDNADDCHDRQVCRSSPRQSGLQAKDNLRADIAAVGPPYPVASKEALASLADSQPDSRSLSIAPALVVLPLSVTTSPSVAQQCEQFLLCLLASCVEWHLRQACAPLLFQEEELEAWQAGRDPVAAAETSKQLQAKKRRGRTEEGLDLHNFTKLPRALAKRFRHPCRLRGGADVPTVQRLPESSAAQKRARELVRKSICSQ